MDTCAKGRSGKMLSRLNDDEGNDDDDDDDDDEVAFLRNVKQGLLLQVAVVGHVGANATTAAGSSPNKRRILSIRMEGVPKGSSICTNQEGCLR